MYIFQSTILVSYLPFKNMDIIHVREIEVVHTFADFM